MYQPEQTSEKRAKMYYLNTREQRVYRVDNYGFDINTHEKRYILKDLATGYRWDIPATMLNEIIMINGVPAKSWTRMPEGWHPSREDHTLPTVRDYPGYVNDPRIKDREVPYNDRYGYDRRYNDINTAADDGSGRYPGYGRR